MERCQKNARYSLRAFARDLGLSASRLSHILSGRYGLSGKAAEGIAKRLGLNASEQEHFCTLVESRHARSKSLRIAASTKLESSQYYQSVGVDSFKLISDWYHLAILELTLTSGFDHSVGGVAKSLGISIHEAESAIARLKRLGMLEEKRKKLVPTGNYFTNPSGVPSDAVRKFHHQMLAKAQDSLVLHSTDERDFSNITVAIDESDLPRAREIIKKIRTELDQELSAGKKKTRVYNLSIQFFPLQQAAERKQEMKK